ncbi:exported hypothetical protein [Hoeflea sp. EC-HK425]|nr:exported hypothetical protein [Hoeflea sp. EC-HK425]|tara:strand:- start:2530 stop:2949 length:420 start_codon:yes stop_codon:yes gene_type:complete
MKCAIGVLALTLLTSSAHATPCEVANILFGPIKFDIIKYDGYETAVVRSATFDDPSKNFRAILGEITVDRGSFAVRNTEHVVVGAISPELRIESLDDTCDKSAVIEFVKAKRNTYIILNGDTPVGTMEGRFPINSFGVD